MNKAFVKEAEGESGRCPRCDSPGTPVLQETLDAQLSADVRDHVGSTGYFCSFSRCPIVYFDAFERVVEMAEFGKPVFPKDDAAPICSCFGLTLEDIEADLAEGAPTRTRQALEKAKSAEARCATLSPSGRSCIAEIQRAYMQRR